MSRALRSLLLVGAVAFTSACHGDPVGADVRDACVACSEVGPQQEAAVDAQDAPSADVGAMPTITATARPDPIVAISVLVDLTVTNADAVHIEYAVAGSASVETTPDIAVTTPTATLTAPVIGLLPSMDYTLVAVATRADGAMARSASLSASTSALPAVLPTLHVTTPGAGGSDALLIGLVSNTTTFSTAAIIDRTGRYLWYRFGEVPSLLGFDVQRWSNGHYTIYQTETLTFEEVDLTGTVARTWGIPSDGFGLDGHDLLMHPDADAYVMARGTHMADSTPYVTGGSTSAVVEDMHIVHLDTAGVATTVWNSWPGIGLDETTSDAVAPGAGPIDALHPNSITTLANGNLLVSMRHTDTLYQIDPVAGTIVWRLGGAHSDFTFVGDPLGGFTHQHFARQLSNGDLLLLDNGNLHMPSQSRVVEYAIDETAHTATLVWSYEPEPVLFSIAGGSVVRLDSGNTLISFGYAGRMTEVNASNTVVWEARVSDYMVYRALPLSFDEL